MSYSFSALSSISRNVVPDNRNPFKCTKTSGHWKEKSAQRKFFDELAASLKIKQPEDWHSVTTDTVLQSGGGFINYYYNGSLLKGNYHQRSQICLGLKHLYPEYSLKSYNRFTFSHTTKRIGPVGSKSQTLLFNSLKKLFPELHMEQNFKYIETVTKRVSVEYDVSFPP